MCVNVEKNTEKNPNVYNNITTITIIATRRHLGGSLKVENFIENLNFIVKWFLVWIFESHL